MQGALACLVLSHPSPSSHTFYPFLDTNTQIALCQHAGLYTAWAAGRVEGVSKQQAHCTTRSLASAQGGSSSGVRILRFAPDASRISFIIAPALRQAGQSRPLLHRPEEVSGSVAGVWRERTCR